MITLYRNFQFLWDDLRLGWSYFIHSPYRCNRQFAQRQLHPEMYLYGETPISTMKKIAKEVGLTSQDVVLDLGTGTGRILFWLSSYVRCRVIGIDANERFIQIARRIAGSREFRWIVGDYTTEDYSSASMIYLYGTCLDDPTILRLITRFKELPPIPIITISYPLEDFDTQFQTVRSFRVRYPWGTTTAYINIHQ